MDVASTGVYLSALIVTLWSNIIPDPYKFTVNNITITLRSFSNHHLNDTTSSYVGLPYLSGQVKVGVVCEVDHGFCGCRG